MQELAEFDFELRHIPGKRHIPADFLSQPFGVNQGKDDNEDMVLLPPARFAQILFPEELEQRHEILRLYHDHLLAGHPGISNTTCYDFSLHAYHTTVDSYQTYRLLTHYAYPFSEELLDRRTPFCTNTYQAVMHSIVLV